MNSARAVDTGTSVNLLTSVNTGTSAAAVPAVVESFKTHVKTKKKGCLLYLNHLDCYFTYLEASGYAHGFLALSML